MVEETTSMNDQMGTGVKMAMEAEVSRKVDSGAKAKLPEKVDPSKSVDMPKEVMYLSKLIRRLKTVVCGKRPEKKMPRTVQRRLGVARL